MTVRRAGRLLLEFLFPLYSLASTPERKRYWRGLSLRRSAKLLVAVFFILCGVAFFIDLVAGKPYPLWTVLLLAGALGGLNILVILAELRSSCLLAAPLIGIAIVVFAFAQLAQQQKVTRKAAHERILLDASCLLVAMLLSYRLFLSFTATEGVAHVELQTELAFAHAIQTTLVPPVARHDAAVEVYGRTIPSERVGGDLVDVVSADGRMLAYLADVSGHGIPAGVLMGMVKTAVRQGLRFGQSLPALLDGLNRVLPAVKEPQMYVTLAALQFDSPADVRYIVAGHPPLLHYRHSKQDVIRCGMEQFPLGLFPDVAYASNRVCCGPGDIFALVTDGLTEVACARGEEFGLTRVEELLRQNAARPLPEIFEAVLAAVALHGAQQDDQTLLLVRVLTMVCENPVRQPDARAACKDFRGDVLVPPVGSHANALGARANGLSLTCNVRKDFFSLAGGLI